MAELVASFDHVVIDTAPNIPVPDAVVLSGRVDGVLLVVKAGATPREIVKRGVELQLEESDNLLGLVVNNIERVLPYYYDYHYYGRGYTEVGTADEK
jgi:Mrp family chromosome partitioning ATPase